MRRVLVIGNAGTGKTTLAVRLGEALGLPVIHLDALYRKPGWQSTPRDEWRATLSDLVERDAWVMDGNYHSSLDVRLPEADTVVLLDLPRRFCIWRVITRWLTHIGRTRPDMAPGCPERVDWEFLRWIWGYPRTALPDILWQLDALPDTTRVHHLRSRREIDRFLAAARAAPHA
ncbi:MAG: AAA family ATPase [Gemmatimonadetes bacterium]|nr:AAA family ATPase [Gemmatimonadota bacterium]